MKKDNTKWEILTPGPGTPARGWLVCRTQKDLKGARRIFEFGLSIACRELFYRDKSHSATRNEEDGMLLSGPPEKDRYISIALQQTDEGKTLIRVAWDERGAHSMIRHEHRGSFLSKPLAAVLTCQKTTRFPLVEYAESDYLIFDISGHTNRKGFPAC